MSPTVGHSSRRCPSWANSAASITGLVSPVITLIVEGRLPPTACARVVAPLTVLGSRLALDMGRWVIYVGRWQCPADKSNSILIEIDDIVMLMMLVPPGSQAYRIKGCRQIDAE